MNFLARIILFLALLTPSIASAQFTDQRTWAPTTGGSANAQTVAIDNVVGPPLGVVFRAKAAATNTNAMTINVNGTGAKNVTKPSPAGPVALTGGELQSGQIFEFMYDGTNYQLVSNLNATAANTFAAPQGYLTPCSQTVAVSGCPTIGSTSNAGGVVPISTISSVGTLYYQTAFGNQIPIWNGTQMVNQTFSELTLTLGGSNLASTLYDVCVTTTSGGVYSAGGAPTIVTSVAWTTSTAGSGNRSTGAGTAQISRVAGIWTNAVTITGRNGGTTYSNIPANACTVVATIYIDAVAGQVTFNKSYTTSSSTGAKWSAWNFYNRLPIYLKSGVASNYTTVASTSGFRGAGNSSNASVTVLSGLPEETVDITRNLALYVQSNPSVVIAIGLNGSVSPSGTMAGMYIGAGGSNPLVNYGFGSARFITLPSLPGVNTFNGLESTQSTGQGNFEAGEQFNATIAFWRG